MPNTQVAASSGGLNSRKASARYLDVSERLLDELIKSGQLAAKKLGRNIKIETAELDRFIRDQPAYEPPSAS